MPKPFRPVYVAFVLAALVRPAEPVSAAPPEEMKFAKDKALRVVRKGGPEPLFLSRPEAVKIGDRAFLSGYRVGDDVAVYVPVSDVELIEEYGSVDALRKAWRVPAAAADKRIQAPELGGDDSDAAVEKAGKRGAATAAADIKDGRPVILYYGKPWSAGKPLVDDATGLKVEVVGGCGVTKAFVAEVDAYNAAVREWHAKKAGK